MEGVGQRWGATCIKPTAGAAASANIWRSAQLHCSTIYLLKHPLNDWNKLKDSESHIERNSLALKPKTWERNPANPRLRHSSETKDLKNCKGSSLGGSAISASFLISAPFRCKERAANIEGIKSEIGNEFKKDLSPSQKLANFRPRLGSNQHPFG